MHFPAPRPQTSSAHGQRQERAFVLVAVITVMVLVAVVCLGMLSLSGASLRLGQQAEAQARAEANARLALLMALGELQKTTGPDQRVTANASLVGNENPQWLGVWKTTKEFEGQEYPLIGKKSDAGLAGEPYPHPFIYSDLRTETPAWKEEQRMQWLVSNPDPQQPLDATVALAAGKDTIEMVGTGSVGMDADASRKVYVRKVPVDMSNPRHGSYAWWISDNNQKASVNLTARGKGATNLAVAQKDDPSALLKGEENFYRNGDESFYQTLDKIITYRSAELGGLNRGDLQTNFHDFTHDASGLFVDTLQGGLRKDLTPLLLADAGQTSVEFAPPNADWPRAFSSRSPMIPGRKHAMIGPSFDMLRGWAQMKNLSGLSSGIVNADVLPKGGNATIRRRPTESWPQGINDGYALNWKDWAQTTPRLQPVMTDARWHYYFGYQGAGSSTNLRTHLIPRVCLWNPYNVAMRVPSLVVLMPNPYRYTTGYFEFYLDNEDIDAIRNMPKYMASGWKEKMVGWKDGFRIRDVGMNSKQRLFPSSRYLGFTLEESVIPAGECLVFSPAPKTDLRSCGPVKIGKYDSSNIGNNLLSAKSEQGKDHFYFDPGRFEIELMNGGTVQTSQPFYNSLFGDLVTSPHGVLRYKSNCVDVDGLPFALKSVNGSLAVTSEKVMNSAEFVSMQLINCSNGGANTYHFFESFLPDSEAGSSMAFGKLEDFEVVGPKDPPASHVHGAKLMWLDESSNEAMPLANRLKHWSGPQHSVFNQAPIANWNVRPNYVSRSPASFVSNDWGVMSMGAWMQQMCPDSPRSENDMPTASSNGNFAKFPLGRNSQFVSSSGEAIPVALFDLPNPDHGVLSLAALRHAQVSPFSWHPSYVIGSSLADLHAPSNFSGNPDVAVPLAAIPRALEYSCRWDVLTGKTDGYATQPNVEYGTKTFTNMSDGILQQGKHAPSNADAVKVEGQQVDVSDEIFAYDIAYEVNQNLWDSFFLSSIPLKDDKLSWKPVASQEPLWNTRFVWSPQKHESPVLIEQQLNSGKGAEFAFWNSAAWLKNQGSFNVNSTSVSAWIAVLSGMRSYERETQHGKAGGSGLTVFSRLFKPQAKNDDSEGAAVEAEAAWSGSRELSDAEIHKLAEQIVRVVKERGPFISLADFINRRLESHDTPASRMGVLDEAIQGSGLNAKFGAGNFLASRGMMNDSRKPSWNPGNTLTPDRVPDAKAWGASGFLTQGDVLESIGSSLAARGDTFTIRAYGEARNGDKVVARAMLEATVSRSAEFMHAVTIRETKKLGASESDGANRATDPVSPVNRANGEREATVLSPHNQKFGRRYNLTSVRWLGSNEI